MMRGTTLLGSLGDCKEVVLNFVAAATEVAGVEGPPLQLCKRGQLQLPHEAEALQQEEHVPREVDLVRVEPMPGRPHVAMVVVVPPLAQGGDSEPHVVARVAVRVELAAEAARADEVGD